MQELSRLSGRTHSGILAGCRELAQRGFITWQPPQPVETAVILVAWEESEAGAPSSSGHWMN